MNRGKAYEFEIIFKDRNSGPSGDKKGATFYGSLFFMAISAVLSILNIQKGYWFMAGTTGTLMLGFLAAFVLGCRNYARISGILTAVMCGMIFSIYAVMGENEGFAILWILIVPIIGMSLVGLKIGFILSLYFQIFLIVLFYTPLVYHFQQYYSSTFIVRFPVLYFASFGACTVLMCEKQDLFDRIQQQAYHDGLTGLRNRASYNEYMKEAETFSNLTIVAMDLNGLKFANDTLGHEAGDKLICEAASMIRMVFPQDACFRIGGDEFSVVSRRSDIDEKVIAFRNACPNVSAGYASRTEFPGMSFNDLSKEADKRMYAEKAVYRRIHGTRNDPRL